ncbi:MAG TPA: zinc-binding dehydrogenase, partial [Casimicrobiaceae bacterium]
TNTRNADLVRSLGADHVVDYTRDDFAKLGQRYDLILDCYTTRSLLACRHVLNPNGTYIGIGGPIRNSIEPLSLMLKSTVLSWFGSRKFCLLMAKRNTEDLATLIGLAKDGKLAPAIDRRFPLSEIRDAIRQVMQGNIAGKVVITMEHSGAA